MKRICVAISLLLALAPFGCRSHRRWIGIHTYRKSLAGSNADYEMGSARFSVASTSDKNRLRVTDLNSLCTMDLVAAGGRLSGVDVPCKFSSDSILRGGMVRTYRQVTFDFDQGTVVGLVVNRMPGTPDDVFLEDDFDPGAPASSGRRRFVGLLSNTAQTSGALTPCLGETTDRSSELTIIIESEREVFFPGFRCRIQVNRRADGVISASDARCIGAAEGPSLADIGIAERVISAFEYDSKTEQVSYSARTTGRMRPSSHPARVGIWCSKFAGKGMSR